ncbi:MAG: DNA photolyase [Desulfobacterales bacterium]|nr:DNA photolyase [Desulfobacterales bacterium]MDD4072220.1 DNA photolyase [Desulfobacterales bacterium]MDD4393053.1 DNA photolyase [Desulfobacterales bacterium]
MSIKKLYVDHEICNLPLVGAIQSKLNLPAEIVNDVRCVYADISSADDPVQRGKEVLFLTRNRGTFVRKCPGTRNYTCCDYMILHIGTFCTMDCSYCILQSYFHPPVLQYFVNQEDMLSELGDFFHKKEMRRIGTGEYTDSLIWDFWDDLSAKLVPEFAKQSHAILEIKSKTVAIEALEHFDHRRKTIISWSVNTERIIRSDERLTSSLSARLKAASMCESWGYPVSFHFDPMVIYDGCETEYRQVIEGIFSHVSANNIAWISLGTFRFMPDLKQTIQKRFPDSTIVYGEFIPGLDGKMRYFKPVRIRLYRKIVSWIKEIAPEVVVYFCMEDDEVWKKSTGFLPSEKGGLPKMLDESAIRVCGLNR